MLGRRETLRANSRRAVILRLCTSLGSRRRAGRRCLEAAPPARAPSATASPAAERTKWCRRVCLGMRPGPGPRLAQRAKPNRAARTVRDASGPPAVACPIRHQRGLIASHPPTPGRRRALCPQGSRPRRSEEHTSELQSQSNIVFRLLLEKKNRYAPSYVSPAYHLLEGFPF